MIAVFADMGDALEDAAHMCLSNSFEECAAPSTDSDSDEDWDPYGETRAMYKACKAFPSEVYGGGAFDMADDEHVRAAADHIAQNFEPLKRSGALDGIVLDRVPGVRADCVACFGYNQDGDYIDAWVVARSTLVS